MNWQIDDTAALRGKPVKVAAILPDGKIHLNNGAVVKSDDLIPYVTGQLQPVSKADPLTPKDFHPGDVVAYSYDDGMGQGVKWVKVVVVKPTAKKVTIRFDDREVSVYPASLSIDPVPPFSVWCKSKTSQGRGVTYASNLDTLDTAINRARYCNYLDVQIVSDGVERTVWCSTEDDSQDAPETPSASPQRQMHPFPVNSCVIVSRGDEIWVGTVIECKPGKVKIEDGGISSWVGVGFVRFVPHDEPDGTDTRYTIEARYGLRQGEDWLKTLLHHRNMRLHYQPTRSDLREKEAVITEQKQRLDRQATTIEQQMKEIERLSKLVEKADVAIREDDTEIDHRIEETQRLRNEVVRLKARQGNFIEALRNRRHTIRDARAGNTMALNFIHYLRDENKQQEQTALFVWNIYRKLYEELRVSIHRVYNEATGNPKKPHFRVALLRLSDPIGAQWAILCELFELLKPDDPINIPMKVAELINKREDLSALRHNLKWDFARAFGSEDANKVNVTGMGRLMANEIIRLRGGNSGDPVPSSNPPNSPIGENTPPLSMMVVDDGLQRALEAGRQAHDDFLERNPPYPYTRIPGGHVDG